MSHLEKDLHTQLRNIKYVSQLDYNIRRLLRKDKVKRGEGSILRLTGIEVNDVH